MRYLLTLILSATLWPLIAQYSTDIDSKIRFGLSPFITLGKVSGINENKHPIGGGADLYYSQRVASHYLQGNIGYKRYQFQDISKKYLVEDLHLLLSFRHTIPQANGVKIALGYAPAFVINATDRFIGKQDSIATITYNKLLKNRLSHGIYVGLEFQSKNDGSIDLGYTYVVNRSITNGYYDAIPNHIKIAYNLNFNRNGKEPIDVAAARITLTQLKNDTLYFINRSCAEDFSKAQLDSLLSKNYHYSAYKVLDDSEINATSKQSNVIHFAIIGTHYASYGDPSSTGIYLLDKDLKNTEFPYPYHTTNPKNGNGLSKCIGSLENAAALIRVFNARLSDKF
jgi:hypothetical protein